MGKECRFFCQLSSTIWSLIPLNLKAKFLRVSYLNIWILHRLAKVPPKCLVLDYFKGFSLPSRYSPNSLAGHTYIHTLQCLALPAFSQLLSFHIPYLCSGQLLYLGWLHPHLTPFSAHSEGVPTNLEASPALWSSSSSPRMDYFLLYASTAPSTSVIILYYTYLFLHPIKTGE